MATIVPYGNGYRAICRRLGQSASATFDTEAEAQAWAEQTDAAMLTLKRDRRRSLAAAVKVAHAHAAAAAPAVKRHSVGDLFRKYSEEVTPTKRGARWEAIRIDADFLGKWPLSRDVTEIDGEYVKGWIRALQTTVSQHTGRRLAPETVRRLYGLARAMFRTAVREWKWMPASPFDDVPEPPKGEPRKRQWSAGDVSAMLKALAYKRGTRPTTTKHYIACLILLGHETGMRLGEMVTITRDNVNRKARTVYLPAHTTKTKRERTVPLSPEACDVIDLLPKTGALFPVNKRSVDVLFRTARKAAGVGDLHLHDTRRTALTRMAPTMEALTLAKISGHRDMKLLLDTYYAPDMSEIAHAMKRRKATSSRTANTA